MGYTSALRPHSTKGLDVGPTASGESEPRSPGALDAPHASSAAGRHQVGDSLGDLLRSWRKVRRMSQLDLATLAAVSSRHLSFIETGRALPSRAMVLRLGETLELPLREQNILLHAAGYAPVFHDGPLVGPAFEQASRVVDFILQKQEPYPAWLVDRLWNIERVNRAGRRFVELFLDPECLSRIAESSQLNLIWLMFSPDLLRPWIVNFEPIAQSLLVRLRREVDVPGQDPELAELLQRVLALPDLPDAWKLRDLHADASPVIPVILQKGSIRLELLTTATTFGRPQDVTLQHLWIESCFPGDQETDRILSDLAARDVESSLPLPSES
jgi:transcriptional regulator with XRE-family HTH domain